MQARPPNRAGRCLFPRDSSEYIRALDGRRQLFLSCTLHLPSATTAAVLARNPEDPSKITKFWG